MKKLSVISLAVAALLLAHSFIIPTVASAGTRNPSLGSGFRCGNLLMDEGVDKLQVLANCGDPVASDKTWIDKYGEVEKLVYGPDAGYYSILYFFAGKLIQIEEIQQ